MREFLTALSREAERIGAGVLLVAHSNKTVRGNDNDDPFGAGLVSGSTAWHDGVRGVLTMTWENETGTRRLAIAKANYGETRHVCELVKIEAETRGRNKGAIVGFEASHDRWQRHTRETASDKMCMGTNRKDKPCGNKAINGSDYCHQHIDQAKANNNGGNNGRTKKPII